MNKILNPNGGVPLTLTDLVYMQSATFDAFKSVLNAFSNGTGNVRLAGCVVSWADTSRAAKKVSWTAGYVGLHGEVFPVSAGTLDSVEEGTVLYWKITRVQEAQVTLENGQQAARRERSYATLVPESLKDDASVKDNDLKELAYYLKESVKPVVTVYPAKSYTPNVVGAVATKYFYNYGLTVYQAAAVVVAEATLTDGVLCEFDSMQYGFLSGIIYTEGKPLKACIIGLIDNKMKLYDVSGNAITSLTPCSITTA